MDSSYLIKVLRILRKVYPGSTIFKEQNLYEMIQGTIFSKELENLIKESTADIKKMRIDLYVKGQIAVEVHGEQHKKPIRFSNEILDPLEELQKRVKYDEIKTRALAEAGIPLVTIWYTQIQEGLTVESLKELILKAQEISNRVPKQKRMDVKIPKFRTRKESFEARANRLAKARKLRRESYRRSKIKTIKKT